MNKGQTTAILFGLGTGALLFRVPGELVLPFLGLEAGTVLTAWGLYRNSARLRDGLDDLAQTARKLLDGPKSHKALPAPKDEPGDLLTTLLAQQIAPAVTPTTTTARLVLRQSPAPVLAARPAPPPAPSAVLVTYHPELAHAWAADPANAAGFRALGDLREPFDAAVAQLLRDLGLSVARVAADARMGQGQRALLSLLLSDAPLDDDQRAVLDAQTAWWRPYRKGRLSGALIALGQNAHSGIDACNPERPALTYDDLDALDEPQAEDEAATLVLEAPPQLIAPARPQAAPALTRSQTARRLPTGPAYPQARIVGDGGIPTIEITLGRARGGAWHYVPVKHGLIAKGTGGGKTNLLDLILGQLQGLGETELWYGTAKPFVVVDPTDRLDRRPLIASLPAERVALDAEAIMMWLWRATAAMHQRYKDMQATPGWFPPPFVVIFDETKAYFEMIEGRKVQHQGKQVDLAKLMGSYLKQLLILARECGGSVVFTSQDGYCGSLKLSRGELGNLGFKAIHPSLDPNSIANVLPEGLPPMLDVGQWDWLLASGGQVETVAVPRISAEMMDFWGLSPVAEPESEPEAEDVVDAPAVDDTALLRWALARQRAGEGLTLTAAAEHFAVSQETMRAALVRNGMLEA